MSGIAFSTILEALRAETGVVADMAVGPKWLPTRDIAPPRIIVVRKSIDADMQVGAVGGNPRSLGDDLHRCEAHLWTATEDEAEWLRRDLISVLRRIVQGRNYEVSSATWNEPAWSDLGVVLTVPFAVRLPCPARRLPRAAGDASDDLTLPPVTVTTTTLDT